MGDPNEPRMIPIEQCVGFGYDELEAQINARRIFMRQLVGQLYPSILQGEMEQLAEWQRLSRLDRIVQESNRDE